MRRPSRSTTAKRQPWLSKLSPVSGKWPSWLSTNPAAVPQPNLSIDQSPQSSAAGGDDSEFRQRKKAVEGDERDDDRQFDIDHGKI
jgi:hypothetical protein